MLGCAHMATAFHFLISKRLPLALFLPFFSSTGCACSTCSRAQSTVQSKGERRQRAPPAVAELRGAGAAYVSC